MGYRLYICVSKPSSCRRLHEAETGSRLTSGSCATSLNSNHAKRDRRCRSANSRSLMSFLDLSPADFRRFLTVLVDRRLLGSQCCLSTGLVANGIHLTTCCNALSSRSDVTRGLPDLGKSFTLLVCVCFLTSRPTSNSFEGHPCCMHADYLPSLCF